MAQEQRRVICKNAIQSRIIMIENRRSSHRQWRSYGYRQWERRERGSHSARCRSL